MGISIPKELQDRVLSELINLIFGWLKRKRTPTPIPVPEPTAAAPAPAPPAPPPPGVPAPIVPPPSSATRERKIARVVLKVQKAEKPDLSVPDRPADPGNLYDNPMAIVMSGGNFHYGSSFWLDLTAFDEQGEEWQGPSILAADYDYRTKHVVTAQDGSVAFIEGRGAVGEEPDPWVQQNNAGVSWAFRSWKDSLGFNARARFSNEGVFQVVGYVAGVQSNGLTIRTS